MHDFIVEGRSLDTQQMACVTELNHNHLVVAGAGTGKTTTIIGKLKWLLGHGSFQPEDILVLSFTNASAAEMRERIIKETGENINASTFHKLGLEIVKSVRPEIRITKCSLEDFILENLTEEDKPYHESITQVATLAKMNNLDLHKTLTDKKWETLSQKILQRSADLLTEYQAFLQQHNEIDFSDMINLATEFVRNGEFQSSYKFVVVDEYQDISMARYELLKALRASHDYDLFCVGDDWQAIYRFAGSEIDLILHFEKYWGKATLSKIETTYRFPQTLADASGKFVMQNYAQIRKKVKALPDTDGFAITEICADSASQALQKSCEIMLQFPEAATVYFIGRYTRDIGFLKTLNCFSVTDSDVVFNARPDLKISFLTAHKSKGLQADYIFALNIKDGRLGFPSKVESSDIIKALQGKSEKFPHAEERRLFYVLLTRAKKKIYLLTSRGHKSEFIVELEDLLYKKMPIIELGLLGD